VSKQLRAAERQATLARLAHEGAVDSACASPAEVAATRDALQRAEDAIEPVRQLQRDADAQLRGKVRSALNTIERDAWWALEPGLVGPAKKKYAAAKKKLIESAPALLADMLDDLVATQALALELMNNGQKQFRDAIRARLVDVLGEDTIRDIENEGERARRGLASTSA
jgi:hypothetical protein